LGVGVEKWLKLIIFEKKWRIIGTNPIFALLKLSKNLESDEKRKTPESRKKNLEEPKCVFMRV